VKTLASRESADIAYTHDSPGELIALLRRIVLEANRGLGEEPKN